MERRTYGFEIWDNDKQFENGFMLYSIKENLLTPALEEFERGFPNVLDFEEMIKCLNHNKIKTLYTHMPRLDETVCSHPYEINTEYEFQLCEFDGKWNRFNHLEINPNKQEEEILRKNKIELISLTEKEISELERNLKFHY